MFKPYRIPCADGLSRTHIALLGSSVPRNSFHRVDLRLQFWVQGIYLGDDTGCCK